MVLQGRVRSGVSEPNRRERSGRIPQGLRRTGSDPPDPHSRGGRRPRAIRSDPRPFTRHASGRRRHRPDRGPRILWGHRLRREPARTAPRPARPRRRPALRSGSATASSVELDLTVAYGVPIAEVGRQVDSAVRYALRHALDLEVSHLVIHIDGLRFAPAGAPPDVAHDDPGAIRSSDLADSGTDVA